MDQLTIKISEILDQLASYDIKQAELEDELNTHVEKIVKADFPQEMVDKMLEYHEDELKLETQYQTAKMELLKTKQELRIFLTTKKKGAESNIKKINSILERSNSIYFPSFGVTRGEELGGGKPKIPLSRAFSKPTPSFASTLSLDPTNLEDQDLSRWELEPEEIIVNRKDKSALLGQGAFGAVYKGTLRGKEVAVKKLNHQKFNEAVINEFKKEVATLSALRHPNVLLFMGACSKPGNLVLVTELMPKGSVYDLLHSNERDLPLRISIRFAKETALGMNWLHSCNPKILHLDLKTANLLVDEHYHVKIGDFGLAQLKKENNSGKVGSPLYMAPEMLLNKNYDEKCDVYSFGIVLWEVFTKQEPYKEIIDWVANDGKRPPIPNNCPPKLAKLITQCWDSESSNRPSFETILNEKTIENVLLDVCISDVNSLGREIWSKNFGDLESVPWLKFIHTFLPAIKQACIPIDDFKITLFESIVSKNGVVSIDDFGKVLDWFGPLKKGDDFLDDIHDVLLMDGFHGDITSEEAEKKLTSKEKKGAFIIRFSQTSGYFALTVVNKEGVLTHYRIQHRAGTKYNIGKLEYSTLQSVIKNAPKQLNLKKPIKRSKYTQMKAEHENKRQIGGYYAPEIQ